MKCAKCTHKKCYLEGQNCTRMDLAEVKEAYVDGRLKIMKAAACTEGRFYNNLTRLEETVEFCKLMGYRKIGIAFCIGLSQEVKLIEEYFAKFLTVDSVCCKVCGIAKDNLELEQVKEGVRETMCNPLMQAKILMAQEVEFCVTVGLCVGHDALFTGACTVPVSCLVAKDRVLAHNPLGAVYSRYWRKKLGIHPSDQV
ncbi:Hypothetical protein LUCI_0412 [Lucifera butyrica]|uniref:Metal-binding protein n=1 Tax=Lucifera butyrica TaxID=1351585 RepID=A0A498R219_9FIRM|nr:DUF1847 domain-containing protein [Lucifera butyrica]VBB05205.1 Hypothetical protein LUCI_0412 [Lucifera butyrica]